ncbi:iron complex transport system ATP-binding protein [Halanaerobium saccharolyticum]|jgi:iron complex transport system ATP-binding protein|uniref:Iron complex transport system ATP-binding protein n=1 Tax=Halanaerobium saccharolyticum TaxID=43595 RepID=A0A4R7Z7S3_9FIRM|nr:ABC transporter ATP-binding protein [Halanaerobium saccharolyticum]RAK11847.1 iron complex transport system ATP-binding protein [Halanaerobium saccharolyticum]TDW07688.1 iron complex transport system ATP-binding protein [Halanaerobium saccharolyticum]TDX64609.1 iron complex transport system ATP-binding protein [Halanaerobium saccharolyticum]
MLQSNNLSFSYADQKVLKNINFRAEKGEFISILGANGSGKTTFFQCMQGLLTPDAGKILLDGENIKKMTKKEISQKIAVVPQESKNIFDYQVLDMVLMGINPWLSFAEQPGADAYQRAEDILAELEILELKNKSFNKISGGERQLVLIARAIMQKSSIFFLDEPNSHLDFKNTHLILQIMRELSSKHKTVITALHDPNLAYQYSDRVIIIKTGKIIAAGPVEEVMTAENLSRAYEIAINKDSAVFSLTFQKSRVLKQ